MLPGFNKAGGAYGMAVLSDTVWLTTDEGLLRYGADGRPRLFTTADGLPFNDPHAIMVAPDGTLWIGGYERIAQLRPGADGVEQLQLYTSEHGANKGQVNTLMVDPIDGSIWAGSRYGLLHLEQGLWRPPSLPLDDPLVKDIDLDVRALLRDRSNNLWVGYNDGLLRWDGTRWTRFSQEQGIGNTWIKRLLLASPHGQSRRRDATSLHCTVHHYPWQQRDGFAALRTRGHPSCITHAVCIIGCVAIVLASQHSLASRSHAC
jgi:hypothetical protein